MKPKALTLARQGLADAIARRADVEREHGSAVAALEEAGDRYWAADAALHAARDALAEAKPNVGGFIAGRRGDLAELERPLAEAHAAVAVAETDLHRWNAVREALPSVIADKQAALTEAREDVDRAIQAVLQTEAPAILRAVLDGYEAVVVELQLRATVLMVLDTLGAVSPELKDPVTVALRERAPLPSKSQATGFAHPMTVKPEGYHADPVVRAWAAAVEALKHDASAPLPGSTA